jgi:putative hydrolase
MMGQLGRRALGQYDLPLPRPASDDLLLVPANLEAFSSDWRLPPDDVRLWVCLHEVAQHAVLGRPHVRKRLEGLVHDYVSAFEVDHAAFEAEIEQLDPADATSFQSVLGEPETLLSAVQSPAQRAIVPELDALTAAVTGWVDHVVETAGASLVPSSGPLGEVLRRRRVEASWGERYVAKLLGLELRQSSFDRGRAFVDGILERAGEAGLARLWSHEPGLPTPAEVDAPGLWLARIDLPDPA